MTPSADECAKIIGKLNELYARYPQYPQEFFGNVKGVQKRYLVNCQCVLNVKIHLSETIPLFNELFYFRNVRLKL